VTRRETAAKNRRDLHERRIAAQPTVVRKIAQAWAWVFAEVHALSGPWKARRNPRGPEVGDLLAETLSDVVAIAARLNEEGAKR
jgi:hypothetical protein